MAAGEVLFEGEMVVGEVLCETEMAGAKDTVSVVCSPSYLCSRLRRRSST